jgi:hypothetical protein
MRTFEGEARAVVFEAGFAKRASGVMAFFACVAGKGGAVSIFMTITTTAYVLGALHLALGMTFNAALLCVFANEGNACLARMIKWNLVRFECFCCNTRDVAFGTLLTEFWLAKGMWVVMAGIAILAQARERYVARAGRALVALGAFRFFMVA